MIFFLKFLGNTCITNIVPLFILQKRSVRIIHKVDAREHTNELFIKWGLLKLKNIVDLQTLLVMFKAKNRALPENLQKYFAFRSENQEEHGRKFDFKHPYAWIAFEQMCITVCGVNLWNSLKINFKVITTIHHFKKMYKEEIFIIICDADLCFTTLAY